MNMSAERHVVVSIDLTIFDIPQLIERLRESGHAGMRSMADQIARQTAPPAPAEPTDPAVRVIDKNGHVWASDDGKWYSLTGQSSPWAWGNLAAFYGPLEIRP